ncbi:hypothetical protein BU17DRAFT_101330 [Hysterangium stoloniferum]|nr:hypothetical protein BU17DRAFT_101330 [Hysterangium stoloniferum]
MAQNPDLIATKIWFGLEPEQDGKSSLQPDGTVSMDTNAYIKAKSTLEPVYRGHTSDVGDTSWHATKKNTLASLGHASVKTLNYRMEAHKREILSVAFGLANEYLLITRSADKGPGEQETLTCAKAGQNSYVWAPSMHVWAVEEVKVEEAELEGQVMEGIEEDTRDINHEAAREKEAN